MRNRGLYRCDDFKAITRAAGITAKAVAEKAHVRVETLYGLNHGKNVSAETARKIADALNSTVNYIFEPAQTAADLSSNTVNHYHKFLSTVLSTAVKQGLINDNPCTRADPPAYAEDEPTYLQEDDLQKLIQALAHVEIKYRTAIYLLLDSGMRRGELLCHDPPQLGVSPRARHVYRDAKDAQVRANHQAAAGDLRHAPAVPCMAVPAAAQAGR